MNREVERKYLDVDFSRLRERLTALDARSEGVHFERNILFDRQEELFGSRRLLRLRSRQWAGHEDHILTLKLPPVAPRDAAEAGFKIREERECPVADRQAMQGILEGLGYLPAARYEKFRESWQIEGVQVDMDILPFIQVVELEGEAERIRKVEVLLELDKRPTSADSYHVLHKRWRVEQGLPPERSFVFSPSQAARWRAALHLLPEED